MLKDIARPNIFHTANKKTPIDSKQKIYLNTIKLNDR